MLAGAAAAGVTAWAARRVGRLEVTGRSMRPTLEPGDRVLLLRGGQIRLGDLVVVPDPRPTGLRGPNAAAGLRGPNATGRLVVKRVLALSAAGVTVRGDNADASTDSRVFGAVDPSTVRGRVVYRYFPPHRRGRIRRLYPQGT